MTEALSGQIAYLSLLLAIACLLGQEQLGLFLSLKVIAWLFVGSIVVSVIALLYRVFIHKNSTLHS